MPPALHAEFHSWDQVSPALVEGWHSLAGQAVEPNPFAEPAVVLPAARNLPGRDRTGLMTVRDRAGAVLACLAVRPGWRWRKLVLPATASWRHDYCFVGTPLVGPDRSAEAVAALLRTLTAGTPGRTAIFEWIVGGGPVASLIDEAAASERTASLVWERFTRPGLTGPHSGGLTLSSHRRERLASGRRRLADRLGTELEVVDRVGDRGAVEQFLALEAACWKGDAGSAMLSRPGHADFFRALCLEGAATGRVQLMSLQGGGTVAAMLCTLTTATTTFWFKTAYDQLLHQFSPGRLLMTELAEQTWADGRGLDPCGTGDWLDDLMPDRLELRTVLVPPAGAVGRATRLVLDRLRQAKGGGRDRGLH